MCVLSVHIPSSMVGSRVEAGAVYTGAPYARTQALQKYAYLRSMSLLAYLHGAK